MNERISVPPGRQSVCVRVRLRLRVRLREAVSQRCVCMQPMMLPAELRELLPVEATVEHTHTHTQCLQLMGAAATGCV